MKFVTELAKMRAFVALWDDLLLTRLWRHRRRRPRFRYGVQVNSLGLTEQQPENNVARILIEMLAVTLSRDARARAVQLPAWNEALGLPRPFDQQWSLRLQQILALETDLLAYPDLFEGSTVMAGLVDDLMAGARALMAEVETAGGAIAAAESGSLKRALVERQTPSVFRRSNASSPRTGRGRRQPPYRRRALAARRRRRRRDRR